MVNKIGSEFIKKTQFKYLGESDQSKGIKQPLIEMPYNKNKPVQSNYNIKDLNLLKLIEER